jgi:hypothetical protein
LIWCCARRAVPSHSSPVTRQSLAATSRADQAPAAVLDKLAGLNE